jgi:aspartate racemase
MGAARTIGVIGGMGPDATADFFAKLIAATRAARPSAAERDQDHLRVVIDSDPTVPDRTEAITGRGPSPAPRLASMARGLVGLGAEVLVMPCNAAHAFADAIVAAAPDVPFLDLIDTTVDATLARLPHVRSVGLLATDGTLAARLYHAAYERRGVQALEPAAQDQRAVMAAIGAIKGGTADEASRAAVRAAAERLAGAGAEAVIAACTEIPLLLREGEVRLAGAVVPVIASTDVLVERTVAVALAQDRRAPQRSPDVPR